MTIEERAARAVKLKAGCNCAQAVVLSYADKLPLEEETLRKLAAGYGGGMGCMEGTCGALVGAVMAAGMLTDGQGTGRYAREILLGFRERCGATICKDLKGVETGKVLCPCTECVRNAVLAAGAALGE